MHILFLDSLGKKKWGGGEKWMLLAAKGLEEKGHKVVVGCSKDSVIRRNAEQKNLKTENISFSSDFDFVGFIKLKRAIKKHNITHIVCGQNKDTKISSVATLNNDNVKIIARHGLQLIRKKLKYKLFFTKLIDGIITNSETIKNEYDSYNWFSKNFVKVIYNGVDIPKNDEVEDVDLHELLSLKEDTITFLSAGRLAKQKGYDTLIKVAELAKSSNKNWHFIVIGKGKLEQALKKDVLERGVESFITFLGFQKNVLSYMKSADFFVLPSLYEGMPNAVLEAMSIGKCCITTNVNGNKELISDKINGILVEPNNFQQLYNAIDEVVNDIELKKEIEKNALENIITNFTIEKMINSIEEYLLNL